MTCAMCAVGYHLSCLGTCACSDNNHELPESVSVSESVEKSLSDDDSDTGSRYGNTGGRSYTNKSNRNLKDQQSTGRKRAAKLYPLDREAPCEWQRKAHNGGGPHPMIGCLQGLQEARHHGPDKSVTNNEEGNVHRICHRCHYNWHARNDGEYDWNETLVSAHKPHECNSDELMEAAEIDLKYMANKSKRKKMED